MRPHQAGDERFIAELARRAFTEYALDAEQATLRMTRSGRAWVACRDEDALGFAVARRTGADAELCAIAVEEHARGSGVGATLLARVERELAVEGARELRIHTAEANVAALELFLKRGFVVARRLPRYYRGMFNACELRKRITP